MKKRFVVISIAVIALFVMFCNKNESNIVKIEDPHISRHKVDSTEYYNSLLLENTNYQDLISDMEDYLTAMLNAGITSSQYYSLMIDKEYDSLYSLIGLTSQQIANYDTIFTYNANMINQYFNITPSTEDCFCCGLTDSDRIDYLDDFFDYLATDSAGVNDFYDYMTDQSQGQPCHYAAYLLCGAGCIATFGEIPPVCIFCIWICACEYCPSAQLHCNWFVSSN